MSCILDCANFIIHNHHCSGTQVAKNTSPHMAFTSSDMIYSVQITATTGLAVGPPKHMLLFVLINLELIQQHTTQQVTWSEMHE
jgi:hypothetical protein